MLEANLGPVCERAACRKQNDTGGNKIATGSCKYKLPGKEHSEKVLNEYVMDNFKLRCNTEYRSEYVF